ncbi:MAG: multiheme c-type cytochrome, partial [Burkholderiales bacterium]
MILTVFSALVLAAGGAAWWLLRGTAPAPLPSPLAAASHVGAKTCAECHAQQYDAWKGSHHALAMQVADDKSVLGNFEKAKFRYAGVTTTFFKRDGKFYVNTDGPDGKLADFEIQYTFGVTPLQQY